MHCYLGIKLCLQIKLEFNYFRLNHRSIKTSRRYLATSESSQIAIARSLYGKNFNLEKIDCHGGLKSDIKMSIPSDGICKSLMNSYHPELRYRCLLAYDYWKLNGSINIDEFLKETVEFRLVKQFGKFIFSYFYSFYGCFYAMLCYDLLCCAMLCYVI